MAVKGLKTCDDILSYLSYVEKKYAQLESELEKIKIGLFTSNKNKLKEKKSRIKGELERYSEIYEYYDDFFNESTTFARKDLSLFLAKYFSMIKGKTYEVQRGVQDISDSKYAKSCDFIASTSDFERIDKKYKLTAPVCLDEVIDMCKDSCLSLGGSKTHTLIEDSSLNSDFKAFPEIIDVAKKLIDVKLSHPNLTDNERLDFILRELASSYELKRQELLLGASVSEEPEQPIIVAPSTRSVHSSPVSTITGARETSPKQAASDSMSDAISRAILNMQSTVVDDECPYVVSPVVQPVTQKQEAEPESGKKLSKSMMERYIKR